MAKLPYSYPTLSAQQSPFGLAQEVAKMFQRIALAFNEPDGGASTDRPTEDLTNGQFFFDTTLGKPIWYEVATGLWVDATGTPV